MADSAIFTRLLNPWVLHLQKMGLELKCPLCLDLFNRPLLLPCNHIFCSSCVPNSTDFKLDCPICKSPYVQRDLRPAPPHMENMVNIYRTMDAAFGATLFPCISQADPTDSGLPISQSPVSENTVNGDKVRNVRTEVAQNKKVLGSHCPAEMNKCFKISEQIAPSSPYRRSEGENQNRSMDHPRQVTQASPDSPPSFGDTKDSDDDSSNNGGQHSAKRLAKEGAIKKESEDKTCRNLYRGPISNVEENHIRETKRKLDPEGAGKPHSPLSGAQPAGTSDYVNSNPTEVCAFCQSSKLSEGSGPMWHFSDGKRVAEDDLPLPNVLHVHRKCFEWAPQVYYAAGETVKNLEAEIARGAKLKCSSCGLKGAALGCCIKSCRRSFHVPCAVNIPECRWDCEDFLLLCSTHASMKFPNERSKRRKKLATDQSCITEIDNQQSNNTDDHDFITEMGNQQSIFWTASPSATSEWVLCGSALNAEEKNLLAKFARLSGATVAKTWNPNVTHVVASTDEMGACTRTLKVLMAISNGKWVLKIDWIKACMEAKIPVSEDPYEVSLDIHGCREGPKKGRLRAMEKEPKLFSGLNFCFNGEFVPSYKGYLEDLVLAAGGSVLTKDILVSQACDPAIVCSTTFVIYSVDPPQPQVSISEEVSSFIERRRRESEALGAQTGSRVIGHTWVLESIAACELQPSAWPSSMAFGTHSSSL